MEGGSERSEPYLKGGSMEAICIFIDVTWVSDLPA